MAADGRGLRDETNSRPFCELCGALENLKLCSGCERSYYCTREHQLSNWRQHKYKCGGKRSVVARRRAGGNGESARADDMAGGGGRLSTEPVDGNGRRPGQSRTHDQSPGMRQNAAADQSVTDPSNLLQDIGHVRDPDGNRPDDESVIVRGIQPYLSGDGAESTSTNVPSLDYELEAVGLPASVNGQIRSRPMRVTMAPDASSTSQAAEIGYHGPVNMKKTRSLVDCTAQVEQAMDGGYSKSETCEQKMTGMTLQSRSTISKVSSEPTFGTVRHPCHTRVSSVENLSAHDVGAAGELPNANRQQQNVFKIPNSVDHKGKRKMQDCKSSSIMQESTKMQQEETRLADYVVKCLNDYGMCVVDTFMGEEKGTKILNEVCELQKHEELFHEGQTAQGQQKGQEIRGDKIAWVEKDDPGINYIGMLITRLDALMLSCSRRLGHYHINGRTKAMVACYPGQGKGYKCHVDNPNGDGRCVTCIYYINKDWDIQKHGGLLRIFPTMFNYVADIVPKFDRLLFFWSDRRNPHEVQPAYRPRLAITVWYFDAEERKKAKLQYAGKGSSQSAGSGGSQVFEIQKHQ